jgi:hypothetical protein
MNSAGNAENQHLAASHEETILIDPGMTWLAGSRFTTDAAAGSAGEALRKRA